MGNCFYSYSASKQDDSILSSNLSKLHCCRIKTSSCSNSRIRVHKESNDMDGQSILLRSREGRLRCAHNAYR